MAARDDWVRVVLSGEEQRAATRLGTLRYRKWDARVQVHGSVTLENNLLGAQGEYAWCQLLGKPHPHPDGNLDDELAHGSDCYGWEIRTASQPGHGLNLHRGDEHKLFILALAHEAPVIWVVGCLPADEAFGRNLGRWREDGEGDRRWYLVGQQHLRPIFYAGRRGERRDRPPAVAGQSQVYREVRQALGWHRQRHGWRQGMVWDPGSWRPGQDCGCAKPCGAYVWPGKMRQETG
jgi:hypothetical protein